MSPLFFFLQGIPEGMGVVAMSLAVARVPLRWGYILLGGLVISGASFIIRSLPVTFGLHLPVVIFLIFIFIVGLTRTKPSRAIISIFTSVFALVLLEFMVSTVYLAYKHIDYAQAQADQVVWAAIGVFQALLLITVALVIPRFLKADQEAWKK